jgi:two-component system osmolarity sensor histidine kinase EnvZ
VTGAPHTPDTHGLRIREAVRALVLDLAGQELDVRIDDLPEQAQWLEPASAVALERALRNLIDNARHYGAPPIGLALRADTQGTVLAVRDHGPGVAASAFHLVTQPFYRGEVSRGTPGTPMLSPERTAAGNGICRPSRTKRSGRAAAGAVSRPS